LKLVAKSKLTDWKGAVISFTKKAKDQYITTNPQCLTFLKCSSDLKGVPAYWKYSTIIETFSRSISIPVQMDIYTWNVFIFTCLVNTQRININYIITKIARTTQLTIITIWANSFFEIMLTLELLVLWTLLSMNRCSIWKKISIYSIVRKIVGTYWRKTLNNSYKLKNNHLRNYYFLIKLCIYFWYWTEIFYVKSCWPI
jgi:hypothetical protein